MQQPTPDETGPAGDRRATIRTDPYDVLVRDQSDIIGLVAYSIFREKKKRILEDDSGDRSRHFFFDSTIRQYEDELREMALIWYERFYEKIDQECSRKHLEDTREYINLKFNDVIQSQKKFRWWESITSSVAATVVYTMFLILAAVLLKFHASPLDIIAGALSEIGLTLSE